MDIMKNLNSKNHDLTPLISSMTDHASQYGHSNEFLAVFLDALCIFSMRLDHNEWHFVVNYLRDPYNKMLQTNSMSRSC